MPPLHLLYDGWPLVYTPLSPAAIHLRLLLTCQPEGVQGTVAIPDALAETLPPGIASHVLPTENTPAGRFAWEQRTLSRSRQAVDAHLLHLTRPTPPLGDGPVTLLSPSVSFSPSTQHGVINRLSQAFAQGGMSRVRKLLLPSDISFGEEHPAVVKLPPTVPDGFRPGDLHLSSALYPKNLPENYVLYHGPEDHHTLTLALNTWTWAAGPVGQSYPLVFVGLSDAGTAFVKQLTVELGMVGSVICLPVQPQDLALLYHRAAVLFHPAEAVPWCDPLRLALTAGLPIVSIETPINNALVGPAAFLRPSGDSRQLGAALITIIVQEEVGDHLRTAALAHTAGWNLDAFRRGLAKITLA